MFELKPLSKNSVPNALNRAKHYRLLNEPWHAESICRDILTVEPEHQTALYYLILALTDQFGSEHKHLISESKEFCAQIQGEYERHYYRGIISERQGKAALKRDNPRVQYIAYEFYRAAMDHFEAAEKIRPADNEDSVLRWNACVRAIEVFNLEASPKDEGIAPFLDV